MKRQWVKNQKEKWEKSQSIERKNSRGGILNA